MSKKMGQYFIGVVENNELKSIEKLSPKRMVTLFQFLVTNFGDNDYDTVADIFNYFPVSFTAKYSKPVECLYIDYGDNNKVLSTGYIVYAYNKTKAEEVMQYHLKTIMENK